MVFRDGAPVRLTCTVGSALRIRPRGEASLAQIGGREPEQNQRHKTQNENTEPYTVGRVLHGEGSSVAAHAQYAFGWQHGIRRAYCSRSCRAGS